MGLRLKLYTTNLDYDHVVITDLALYMHCKQILYLVYFNDNSVI